MTQIFVKSAAIKITIYPSACYPIYYTIPLRIVGSNLTLTLRFHVNLSYFLFILHFYERIYIYINHGGYVCSACISIVLLGYITNFLTLKCRGFHSDSNRRPFALQSDALSITPSDPEALSDILGYITTFLINYDFEIIIKYFSVIQFEISIN